jgi:hypothetical protein
MLDAKPAKANVKPLNVDVKLVGIDVMARLN